MNTKIGTKVKKKSPQKDLEKKAAFLDELLGFIEEKSLGFLMEKTETEKSIKLDRARNMLS